MTALRIVSAAAVLILSSPVLSQQSAKISEDDMAARVVVYCAGAGLLAPLKSLHSAGVNINLQDVNGRSALSESSELGHDAVVKYLLSKGADKTQLKEKDDRLAGSSPVNEDPEAQIALIFAVRWNIPDMVRFFIDSGVPVDTQDSSGSPAVAVAAAYNHLPLVSYFIGRKADVNLINGIARTPLDHALIEGSPEGALLIAQAGGRTQSEDVGWYEKKLLAVITKKDAALETKNPYDDRSLMMYAAERNHPLVIRYLVSRGADKNTKFNSRQMRLNIYNGSTPLILALRDNAGIDAAYELIRSKASLDDLNSSDETALLCAVYHADIALAKALLDAGANVNRADSFGKTPLYHARMNSDAEMMTLLKSRGGK